MYHDSDRITPYAGQRTASDLPSDFLDRDLRLSSILSSACHQRDLWDLDTRLLKDIGLIRTDSGDLALAADPARLVAPPNRLHGILAAFRRFYQALRHDDLSTESFRDRKASSCSR